jgi:hypothetical protein
MVSYRERLDRASAELAERNADPLRGILESTVRGMDAISTYALLNLIGLPTTAANGRRVSRTMRALGFIPLQSRRFMPGGFRDTVTRGWVRPMRDQAKLGPRREALYGR